MTTEQERQFTRVMLVLAALAFAAVYTATVADRGLPEEALVKGALAALGLGALGRVAVRLIGSASAEERPSSAGQPPVGAQLDARSGASEPAPRPEPAGTTPARASAGQSQA